MFKFAAASAGVTAVAAANPNLYEDFKFEAYLQQFGKSYPALQEYKQREEIFNQNLLKVQTHNAEYNAGTHTWFAAVNELADRTDAEFQTLRSKKYSPSQHPVLDLSAGQLKANPASMDWREKGAVTPVKNQGGCGSCWAFSATETVESHYQIATSKSLVLAPQTYVNCVKNPQSCGGTGGCEGATMELAFNLTRDTGIALESDLPYRGSDQTCKPYKAAVKCTGYVKNPENSAIGLETALATKGPMAITVAAGSWQFYGGGIFHGCSKGFLGRQDNTLDHGVQAVGYTADYWIVRNSWGAGWGEKGFIRIQRATDNKTFVDKAPADGVACKPVPKTQTVGGECGILFDTSYPTGVTAASVGATDDVEWGCQGSGDPVAGACYEGSSGALGVKETVKVSLLQYTTGAGYMDLTGTGVKGFTCSEYAFTKSGQDVSVDLSNCLPSGITVPKLQYCSNSDTIAVTVKDSAVPIPISTTLKKVTCPSTIVV